MGEDAEFLRDVIRRYSLDIVSPQDLQGLIARHRWLRLGHISAGRYDLVRSIPAVDKQIAQLGTLTYRQFLRAAGRPRRASHAGRRGASGFHPRQSPELHELCHCVEAGTFGSSIFS
jgi:hypothetical protein